MNYELTPAGALAAKSLRVGAAQLDAQAQFDAKQAELTNARQQVRQLLTDSTAECVPTPEVEVPAKPAKPRTSRKPKGDS